MPGSTTASSSRLRRRRRTSSCGTGEITIPPFYRPDVHVVLFDPFRPGHELTYYPGETNMLMADIAIINKVDTAPPEGVAVVRRNIGEYAPDAAIILAESPIIVSRPEDIRGKRVLVVEDGPTLTPRGYAPTARAISRPRPTAPGRSWIPGSTQWAP